MPTQEQLNNLIYKYIQGFPYTSTVSTRSLEQPGSAFPILSSNKIRTNNPPDTAPFASSNTNYPTSNVTETIFPDYPTINSGTYTFTNVSGGKKYVPSGADASYSFMSYYVNLPLKCVDTNNRAFYDASTNGGNVTGTNKLIGAIPSNYDPANASYKIFVFNLNTPTTIIDPDGSTSWYFDPNSGYLIFDNPIDFLPTMTFWRYEGPYGISSQLAENVVLTDAVQTLTNKTTIGITDLSLATFHNMVINGSVESMIIDNELSADEIYSNKLSLTGNISSIINTGVTPKSFVYNSNTMCFKDAIIPNSPNDISNGNLVRFNSIGLIPHGDQGITVTNIDRTNRTMTFSSGNFISPVTTKVFDSSLCAIISGNSFISYTSLSSYVNYGIKGPDTSSNQPFIQSLSGSYIAITPTQSLTTRITSGKKGYIDNDKLISAFPFSINKFISMTGLTHPSYISGQVSGVSNEYIITSRGTITNTPQRSFFAVPITQQLGELSTLLIYDVSGTPLDMFSFITPLNNIKSGTVITTTNATGSTTLSIGYTPPTITTIDVSGYVSSNTLKLETYIPIDPRKRVVGSGELINGIPVYINSFISSTPTGQSSTYTIKSGTGNLIAGNTTSITTTGYVRSFSNEYWFVSDTSLNNNHFIDGSGIPQATRLNNPSGLFSGQQKIMRLSHLNGNTISQIDPSFSSFGYITDISNIRITGNATLNNTFLIDNSTNFTNQIPIASKISTWNSTNQIINVSNATLTPTDSSGTYQGFMGNAISLEVRGLGNSINRKNFFFTGTGMPANKNYVTNDAFSSPFTIAGTGGSATVATDISGFTRDASGDKIQLVVANRNVFSTSRLIKGGQLPTNDVGLVSDASGLSGNAVQITADFSYNSSHETPRFPLKTASPNSFKAYSISATAYYILGNTVVNNAHYIESFKEDGSAGFAGNLNLKGTGGTTGAFTGSSRLGISSSQINQVGATFLSISPNFYYFCSKGTNNLQNKFISTAAAQPALQSSVIYNTTTFDKGSNNISQLNYNVTPTQGSTPVTNANRALSYIVKSSTDASQNTKIWSRSVTRITGLAVDQFFIHDSSLNTSPLNGTYIVSFTQPATLLGFSATLRGNTNVSATNLLGTSNFTFSGPPNTIFSCSCESFTPQINDFCDINDSTDISLNYITAVTNNNSPLRNFQITLAYSRSFISGTNSVKFIRPISTTASILIPTTTFTAYDADDLVIYTPSSGALANFKYYTPVNYTMYTPIQINFYNQQYNIRTPQLYTIQTALEYKNVPSLDITDYSSTTISLYSTQDITFYKSYDITLAPTASILVGDTTTQTLTNKTLVNPYITGNVGINQIDPQFTLDVTGTIRSTGQITAQTFNALSDYRLKSNIENLPQDIIIDNLRPVHYDMNDSKRHDIGFIAHEVQEIFPFLVTGEKDGTNFQSLNYNGFIALLVKEIKDLKSRLFIAEKQIEDIISKI